VSAVLWRTQRCASHLFGRCRPGLRALRGRAAACAVLLWVAPKCTTGAFALLQHSNAAVGLPLHSRAATPRVAVDQQLADHVRCRTHLIGRGGGAEGRNLQSAAKRPSSPPAIARAAGIANSRLAQVQPRAASETTCGSSPPYLTRYALPLLFLARASHDNPSCT